MTDIWYLTRTARAGSTRTLHKENKDMKDMSIKAGDTIRIINMSGEPAYTGKMGTVDHIDDAGHIHGTWGGLSLIPDEDEYEIVKEN